MNILITGGAEFIGSTVFHYFLENTDHQIISVDKSAYAADLGVAWIDQSRYRFAQTHLTDRRAICKPSKMFCKPRCSQYLLQFVNERR